MDERLRLAGPHVEAHYCHVRILPPWRVEHRRHRPLDAVVLDVGDDADDLDVQRVAPDGHELAHRALAQVELLHESLIHHGDPGRAPMVRRGELAAGARPDAQGCKVAGANLVAPRVSIHVGAGREALHVNVRAPVGPGQEGDHRAGHTVHAGDRAHLVLHAAVEQQGAGAVVAAPFRREAERDHTVDLHPEIHAGHVDQALHEQPRGDEQRGGQGDLDGDQRRAEPGGAPCPRDLAGVGANCRDQLRAGAVPGREHAEHDPRGEREHGREDQHHGPETEPERAHDFGRSEGGDAGQSPVGHEQTGQRAQAGEEHRLGEQLGDQLAAVGPQGQTDAHVHGAAGASRQQQIRDVGARDEQHDRGDAEQHE